MGVMEVDEVEVREELLKRALSFKKAGAYEAAKATCFQALQVDPLHKITYVHLGNIAYLLGQQSLAVRSYLALTHLQLYSIENHLIDNTLTDKFKKYYDEFPKEELDKLPLHSAFVIYLDGFITRQVAHAMIDLTKERREANQELEPYIEIYKAVISEDPDGAQLLDKYNLDEAQISEAEKKHYIPFGQQFLLHEIDWDKIFRNDVINIYFEEAVKK